MSRPRIIDVSKYQVSVDAEQAKRNGSRAIIMRASYGMHRDEAFDVIYPSVATFVLNGAYHYFSTAVPWQDQANRFLDIVTGLGFRKYFLDYEGWFNNLNEKTAHEAGEWCEYVAAQSGVPVELYTGAYILRDDLLRYVSWPNNRELWIARYQGTDPDASEPNLIGTRANHNAPSGKEWILWQYSADGNGLGKVYGVESRDVDLNVFNGTDNELREWWMQVEVDPDPVDPIEVDCSLDKANLLARVKAEIVETLDAIEV